MGKREKGEKVRGGKERKKASRVKNVEKNGGGKLKTSTHITVSEVGRIAIGRSSSDLPDLVTHATSAENCGVFFVV